jgi:hypothetical protein
MTIAADIMMRGKKGGFAAFLSSLSFLANPLSS